MQCFFKRTTKADQTEEMPSLIWVFVGRQCPKVRSASHVANVFFLLQGNPYTALKFRFYKGDNFCVFFDFFKYEAPYDTGSTLKEKNLLPLETNSW